MIKMRLSVLMSAIVVNTATMSVAAPPTNDSLSPSQGYLAAGAKYTLTTKHSDADGYANLASCRVLINGSLNAVNSCYLFYDCNANKLYIRNEASTGWLGGFAPGSSNIIQNSYCKLYCAETTVNGTGNTLTITWRVELTANMPNSKAWLYVTDDSNLSAGWSQAGTFQLMIYIPAGGFLMGNSGIENDEVYATSFPEESPQHSVSLSGYYINKYEVTRGEYRAFMTAGGYSNSAYWSTDGWSWKVSTNRTEPDFWAASQNWVAPFTQTDNFPVVGVTYYEAEAFCKWAGGRLPTEAEWEKAARWTGSVANVYPWGNTWNIDKCNNWDDTLNPGSQPSEVGSYPDGVSPYGLLDMAGNVTEWCKDWYGSTYYGQTPPGGWSNPQGPSSGENNLRVIRGGSWKDFDYNSRSAFRDFYSPNASLYSIGFRLARTAPETVSTPGTPSGDQSPVAKISYTYSTTGASCSEGHPVAYSFNWGDGTSSPWSTSTSASHAWASSGPKNITVTARCQVHTTISATSSFLSLAVMPSVPSNDSLLPNSGSLLAGTKTMLVTKFSHPGGYGELAICRLLINSSLNAANGCYFYYDFNYNRLYLRNDSNTAWLGGFIPGSANVIENSYCKLHCAGTTRTGSGTTLTVNWQVEFKPLMVGKSCPAWLYITDDNSTSVGWAPKGTFQIDARPPVNLDITPNSGSLVGGTKQTLTTRYSHPDGYGSLAICRLLINDSLSGTNGCYFYYDFKYNRLYLRNDSDTAWLGGFTPGSNNVIQNSYCKLYCAGTTRTGSGTTLTVNWQVEFTPLMAGKTCPAWLYVTDDYKFSDGWDQVGTFQMAAQPPANVSVSPNSGQFPTVTRHTFTSQYSDASGYANIASCRLLINTTLSGVNGCYLYYDANADKLWLQEDSSPIWKGGFAPGSDNVIENSYCKLDCSQTTVSGVGTNLTVNWRIEFTPLMSNQSCSAWMYVTSDANSSVGWTLLGALQITSQVPSNVSFSPLSNFETATKYTISTDYADADGFADIASCRLLINDALSADNGCYLYYNAVTNKLYLASDSGIDWLGGYDVGSDNVIENSYCKLYCAETTVSGSGPTLTVNWQLEFKPSLVGPFYSAWMYVTDKSGKNVGWSTMVPLFEILNAEEPVVHYSR